MLTRVVLQR
ncbi:hypothetical protein QZH41_000966 [Actinostola sp. cb2023]|nr:hypothetical protein QZH41_000966 [Actinostola sp. cb2023]